ncbi:MAG TPA: hypothetical protein PLD79_00190 [Halothiobacillus sp.]|nr:hypothetical protein [Halothiobacillus sp.]
MNNISEPIELNQNDTPKIATGASARSAAKWFNYGTLIAVLIPVPLFIFWTGLSMLIYALNKHHPNHKVGEYTQKAAYRFYGVAGASVAVAVFFPPHILYYLVIWGIAVLILIPWTLRDLYLINHDTWVDVAIEPHKPFADL